MLCVCVVHVCILSCMYKHIYAHPHICIYLFAICILFLLAGVIVIIGALAVAHNCIAQAYQPGDYSSCSSCNREVVAFAFGSACGIALENSK